MYYYKSAVLSHFKIGDFVSFWKSAILSRFQNRRFCPVFKIGDFVPFSKSAVLSHSKIGGFVSHPFFNKFNNQPAQGDQWNEVRYSITQLQVKIIGLILSLNR